MLGEMIKRTKMFLWWLCVCVAPGLQHNDITHTLSVQLDRLGFEMLALFFFFNHTHSALNRTELCCCCCGHFHPHPLRPSVCLQLAWKRRCSISSCTRCAFSLSLEAQPRIQDESGCSFLHLSINWRYLQPASETQSRPHSNKQSVRTSAQKGNRKIVPLNESAALLCLISPYALSLSPRGRGARLMIIYGLI